MDADPSLADRITRLEVRIAHQDHLLATLDEIVREFTTRVATLERTVRLLEGSLGSGWGGGEPPDEPPPHY